MIKRESRTTITTTTTGAFSSVISCLAITASPESVLGKLILQGTVKLRTPGKVAVVVKRVARASSLPSAEPAFNLSLRNKFFNLFLLWGSRPLNTWL